MKGKPAKTARPPTIRRDTLDCVLDVHWFNEIKYGKKRVEYREIGQYWRSRIFAGKTPNAVSAAVEEKKTAAPTMAEYRILPRRNPPKERSAVEQILVIEALIVSLKKARRNRITCA